ncbi:MAG TPA: N-acetyltransferase [Mesotoga sp.]|mgnify:CR=1 FL=1|nr:N-acetyltransferase [Mesotoga sp.]MDD4479573.1 N-acetyltransferase [Mesotoga sp.]HPI18356.1 N-acetyltransferase [Mesotoga sp.]HPM95720.1 N-acetyltransferase [Mesotoga sp.]HQQ56788.1 N-acetyltransferase [Mesotoga sp.]
MLPETIKLLPVQPLAAHEGKLKPGDSVLEPIRVSDREHSSAIEILARAFTGDPMVKYVAGEKAKQYVNKIYGVMFRAYSTKGYAYFDSPRMNGMILWIDSGEDPGLGAWIRGGALKMLTFPAGSLGRLMKVGRGVSKVHKECIKEHHLHLIFIAVSPASQGKGIGRQLMSLLTHEADSKALPCYLETQNPSNLRFYESFGFYVAKEIEISPELRSWSMVRPVPPRER